MTEPPSYLSQMLSELAADPDNIGLRLRIAQYMANLDMRAEALRQCAEILTRDPGNSATNELLVTISAAGDQTDDFDWERAESELCQHSDPVIEDIETSDVTLADVAGMDHVKRRLEMAFLGPMRHPEMAAAFGKSPTGGLLLYGPPGCGKTYIARALAGQLGAKFLSVGIQDVLNAFVGEREQHITELFAAARRNAPFVLFFDEIDALGQKRSHLRHESWLRTVVNTLLTEMDSVRSRNEGVFVLGASNHPWDVDTALRRPGRFDRTVAVLPPDPAARAALLRAQLAARPAKDLDIGKIVKATVDFSGADLKHLVDSAAELAMADSMVRGEIRPITMADVATALKSVRPSCGPWLDTAKSVVAFHNSDGGYDDLASYLKDRKR